MLDEYGPDGLVRPYGTETDWSSAGEGGSEDRFGDYAKELEKVYAKDEPGFQENGGTRRDAGAEDKERFEKFAQELQEKFPLERPGESLRRGGHGN